MSTDLKRFRKGDRVRFSQKWLELYPTNRGGNTGVVLGFSKDGPYLRVQRDKKTRPELFHVDFWEHLDP